MEQEIKYSIPPNEFFSEIKSQYPDTLNELLEFSVEKFRERPFTGFPGETPVTYGEFFNMVLQVSEMLTKNGVSKGDRVALLGENSPHWGITYFAIIRTGAVAVPILPDFPESDIRHILADSEAKILFTTQKQLEKLSHLDNTKVKTVIMLDDFKPDEADFKTELLADIIDMAVDFLKKIPKSMGLKSKEITEEDIAAIIYTSGTSGHSKAVMLRHRNLVSNVTACTLLMDFGPEDKFLSILPLSHTYEFTIGFLLPLIHGASIVYLDKTPTPRILEQVCKTEKPTTICAVPLILEKIFKKKVMPGLQKNMAVKMLTRLPGIKQQIYKSIAKKLVNFFGGNLRVMAVGGASFNSTAEQFFKQAGFPYLVGYGLTETAPLLAGGPWSDKTINVGSTGKPTPGCELKIVDPDPETGIGEIYGRGPNVMKGYYKNPELTKEVLDDDGWFKTGDLGYFDKYDNLNITGRSKNMIVMANGENVYPEAIEEKLNACTHVMESLVIENNDQLEGWIYLDYDLIDKETHGKSEQQRKQYIEKILEDTRHGLNAQLSSYSKISRLYEQQEPFVKTATHKIKRYLYAHAETRGSSR